jgi:Polyketide cyclase / dehydrase and lipid transport
MLMNLLLVVVALLVVLVAFVATRPADFRIVRTRTLAAAPGVVHGFINDFHKWPAWSPWEKIDPDMKREHSGAPSGTGAQYHWVGNKKVGEGRMTIVDTHPPSGVTIRLEFLKPFKATNTTQFDLSPSRGGTQVSWAMTGHNGFIAKAFSLFMNMEKVVGPDFEKGLAGLDTATSASKG